MHRTNGTVIAGVGWIAIFLAVAFFGQGAPGLLGTAFFYGGLMLASASAWHLLQIMRGPGGIGSSQYTEVFERHAGREDLCTMEHIVDIYQGWNRGNPGGTLTDFAPWFLSFRYSLPGFDPGISATQRKMAELALPIYSGVLSSDGQPSLLAVLGAVSAGERFDVDPQGVLSHWRDSGLAASALGGGGVEDIRAAFEEAESEFDRVSAALDRGH